MPFLFGHRYEEKILILRSAINKPPDPSAPGWVHKVHAGQLDAVPDDLRWENSVELANLIDGPGLVARLGLGDPSEFEQRHLALATQTGRWVGGPAVLWARV